jgi:AAA+ ATPase superfamily predicted ATPase
MGSVSRTAVLAGSIVCIGVAAVSSFRATRAIEADVERAIRDSVYIPTVQAEGQARSLAADAELREGLTERNRLKLTRAIRRALPQMNVAYAGVLLPDETPYFWLPDEDTRAPIVGRRLPVEHELRTVGTLEYGVMMTDGYLRQLGSALSTEVKLVSATDSSAGPLDPGEAGTGGEVVATLARGPSPGRGYVYLRAPGDPQGPVVAVLDYRAPADSPGAARMRGQRNLLLALSVAATAIVVVADGRRQRRRPRPAEIFSPITNPYIVGNPISSAEMFFGRDDDFQFARLKLTSERAGIVLVFCGERRSGKTSILFQILNGRMGAEFLPVLVDMQYFAAISRDHDFYESVVKEIVHAAYPEDEQRERLKRFDLPTDSAAASFERVLDDALQAHPERTFLFLFDEYEILETKIDRGELSPMVIPYLAGLLERKRRISFIFTGSRNLEERPAAHWRLMLGKSQYRKISYLTRRDAERLITQPVAGRVRYDAGTVDMIVRLTCGQPFYTQVMCQNLVDYLNEAQRHSVSPADVAAIVDAIVDNPLPQMIYFWDSLPADQKVGLSLLAESLVDEHAWGTADGALADARARRVPISVSLDVVEGAFERLFEKEWLAKSAERTFRFRIDLLRHWIRRTHSIWQVLKEAGSVTSAGS